MFSQLVQGKQCVIDLYIRVNHKKLMCYGKEVTKLAAVPLLLIQIC